MQTDGCVWQTERQPALTRYREPVIDIVSSLICLLPLPCKQIVYLHVMLWWWFGIHHQNKWINEGAAAAAWQIAYYRLSPHICLPLRQPHECLYYGCNWAIFLRAAVTHTKLYPNFPLKRGGHFFSSPSDSNHARQRCYVNTAYQLCQFG